MVPIQIQNRIKSKILDFFKKEDLFKNLQTKRKVDNSLVTEIDIFVCQTIKSEIMGLKEFNNFQYYSEEDHQDLKFPSLILDPIDGTKDLIAGFPECSISLALMKNDKIKDGWGWIFNPFTGFDLNSDQEFTKAPNVPDGRLLGLVSRSEWNRGTFQDVKENKIILSPKGSIAFKLGLLAAGAADFVVTRRNKNIWDIAAGSALCFGREIFLFGKDFQIEKLNEELIKGPMIWCKKEHYPDLKFLLGD